ADVHASERERRSRIEARAAVQPRLRLRLPDEAALLRSEAVDVAVVRADVHAAGCERRRALDRPARAVAPDRLARPGVERPDAPVPVADVETVADEERRALGGADRLRPARLAEARRERDHLPGALRARGCVAGRL